MLGMCLIFLIQGVGRLLIRRALSLAKLSRRKATCCLTTRKADTLKSKIVLK